MPRGQTAWLEWNQSYARPRLRRDVYGVDDPLDDDIDAIGIRGTDIVTKLDVAKA